MQIRQRETLSHQRTLPPWSLFIISSIAWNPKNWGIHLTLNCQKLIFYYSHLYNKRGAHAYQFWKIPPSSKKIPPPRLLISLLKCLILLQNLMTIFLTIILSYKTLFYHKNWCLLPPPHLVIFHFWHPSTFIPGSTFIREMRVLCFLKRRPIFDN